MAGRDHSADGTGFPAQIGTPRQIDVSKMDGYEQTIVRLMDHIEDGILVLANVEDAGTAKYAAGMFIEASGRILDLRLQMLKATPDSGVPADIIVAYGPRYLLARVEVERQLLRIKAMDSEVHQPLETVILRIKDDLDQVKKDFEAEKEKAEKSG